MDTSSLNPMNVAAFAMSATALGISLLAMFPGLKGYVVVARDAVLWLALLIILASVGFWSWQNLLESRTTTAVPQPATESVTPAAKGFSLDSVTQ